MSDSFAAEVWNRLYSIDCSKHVKEKGQFSYLSWTWAWGILMENYPESSFEVDSPVVYDDTTVEITVRVTIKDDMNEITRFMWLPVMDFRNDAVPCPDARLISDTRMRCLVKCIALFGLGKYIYDNDSLPREDDAKPIHRFKTGEKELIVTQVLNCLERDDKAGVEEILDEYGDDPAIKIKVWRLFDSTTRASLKTLLAGE